MMRETIIKLLKSTNTEDRALGKEYLKRFYGHELFKKNNLTEVLFNSDLNRILNTSEFLDDVHDDFWGPILILFKDDDKV